MVNSGADLLRLSPRAEGMVEVVQAFDQVSPPLFVGGCNGYWHGQAGMLEGHRGGLVLSRKQWLLKGADRFLPLIATCLSVYSAWPCSRPSTGSLAQPLRDGGFDLLRGRWLCLRIPDLGLCWPDPGAGGAADR